MNRYRVFAYDEAHVQIWWTEVSANSFQHAVQVALSTADEHHVTTLTVEKVG